MELRIDEALTIVSTMQKEEKSKQFQEKTARLVVRQRQKNRLGSGHWYKEIGVMPLRLDAIANTGRTDNEIVDQLVKAIVPGIVMKATMKPTFYEEVCYLCVLCVYKGR